MESPLNPHGAGGETYSASVQFGLEQAERNILKIRANTQDWLLVSRLSFIYDALADRFPLLFPRENRDRWVLLALSTPQGAARAGCTGH